MVMVTVSGGALCPSTVAVKDKSVVDSVSVAARIPVPLYCADCVPTLSTTVRLPVAAPDCVGAKAMETTQAAPAASELPQVLAVFLNGVLTVIEANEVAVPPIFWMVTFCAAEVVATCCVPKLRLAGCSVTLAPARPVPDKGTSN